MQLRADPRLNEEGVSLGDLRKHHAVSSVQHGDVTELKEDKCACIRAGQRDLGCCSSSVTPVKIKMQLVVEEHGSALSGSHDSPQPSSEIPSSAVRFLINFSTVLTLTKERRLPAKLVMLSVFDSEVSHSISSTFLEGCLTMRPRDGAV